MSFDFNVLDIEINIPSDDIRDYTVFVSGPPGTGKTGLVKQIPGSFTIDLDRGTKSHAMRSKQASDWYEVKEIKDQFVQTKKELEKAKKAKENGEKEVEIKIGKGKNAKKLNLPVDVAIEQLSKIRIISIDTINQAKQYAKEYLINERNIKLLAENKNEISTFNELGWDKNDMLEKELMSVINELRDNGYGVFQISHVKDKKENKDTDIEFVKVVPDLQDNERNYLVGAADIEIQIEVEDVILEKAKKNKDDKIVKFAETTQKTWMHLRANSKRAAKSRFVFLPEKIEYGYDNLVNAIKEAVQKEIEYGKNIYDLNDEKVEQIVEKQQQDDKTKIDEMLLESTKQELRENIKELATKLHKNGCEAPKLNAILKNVSPDTIDNIEELKDMLKKLEALQ